MENTEQKDRQLLKKAVLNAFVLTTDKMINHVDLAAKAINYEAKKLKEKQLTTK